MNINLGNNLFGRLAFALLIFSSTACFGQNKPDSSTDGNLQIAPTPSVNAQKCRSQEEAEKAKPPAEQKSSPLNEAAFRRDLTTVKKLLKQNADPNEKDSYGKTPLLNALSTRILEPMTMNPTRSAAMLRDEQKNLRSQPLIVKQLLDSGADVNLSGFLGATPLIEAVFLPQSSVYVLEILSLLDRHQADLNLQDDLNFTALMYAVREKKPELVKFLLAHHARTDLKGCAGETALSIAQNAKNNEIMQILQNVK